MHELSIVRSIIDSAQEQVRKHRAFRVENIQLAIGQLAGVEMDAFNFAWEAATPNTILATADRDVRPIPARARCMSCGCEFGVSDLYEPCPNCREYLTEIVQGRELKIQSITLVFNKPQT